MKLLRSELKSYNFQENLKALYEQLNASGKNLEVVVISGDRDADGFKSTMSGYPWVAVPFKEKRPSIEEKIPCTGYILH